jgi:putative SbcD/Mre11-related phosphoesterase
MTRKSSQLSLVTPHPAFLIDDGLNKTLVVSDLHIGWEVALAEEGIHVPSQTTRLLEKLKAIITEKKIDCLIVLGDIKHTFSKIEHEEWRDVPQFFEEICKIVSKVQVVPGNHDGDVEALLPESVEVLSSKGVVIGDIGLFHGHTWPSIDILGCSLLVIGHVHPIVGFSDPMGFWITRQVWVRAPCINKILAKLVLRRNNVRLRKNEEVRDVLKGRFNIDLKAESLMIMPSFNDFLGGQTINRSTMSGKKFKAFIGPVLRSGSVNLERAETYLLDGTFLGSLEQLRRLS